MPRVLHTVTLPRQASASTQQYAHNNAVKEQMSHVLHTATLPRQACASTQQYAHNNAAKELMPRVLHTVTLPRQACASTQKDAYTITLQKNECLMWCIRSPSPVKRVLQRNSMHTRTL
jgi:hypothetical protein